MDETEDEWTDAFINGTHTVVVPFVAAVPVVAVVPFVAVVATIESIRQAFKRPPPSSGKIKRARVVRGKAVGKVRR